MRLSWPGTDDDPASVEASPQGPSIDSETQAEPEEVLEQAPAPEPAPAAGVGPVQPSFVAPEVMSEHYTAGVELSRPAVSLIVDAYERLGDRVLGRLRLLRVDLDDDLAQLRSEVGSLRSAVEDVADRLQPRQVRGALDELRREVAELRRAAQDRPDPTPELGPVTDRLAELGAVAGRLQESVAHLSGRASGDTAELHAMGKEVMLAVSELRSMVTGMQVELRDVREAVNSRRSMAELAPLVTELGELREEVVGLRRRIALRASASAPITPEQLDLLIEAVTEHRRQSRRPK